MHRSLVVASLLLLATMGSGYAQFGGGSQRPQGEVTISEVAPLSTDEVITIENQTPQDGDLTGWRLELDRPNTAYHRTYAFPEGCRLPAGATVRVHAGPASLNRADQDCDQTQFDLLWQSAFLLPNDRFTLELVDSGGKVVSTYYYPSPVLPPVSINEMEANPASGDEWVEIFNGSAEPMDLQGWTLNTLKGTSAKLSIPLDRIIPARGFILISLPIAFLNDQGEILELRNDKNLVINVTPEAGLPDGLADGRCWARVPDGQEAWMFQACTKGEANA